MSIVIVVHNNYRLAWPEVNGLKPYKYKQKSSGRHAHSNASSPDYEYQLLIIYDGPQLLERTDSTNHQLGSNLHNQSRTGRSFTSRVRPKHASKLVAKRRPFWL